MMARILYSIVVIALLPWALLHLMWRARRQPEYLQHWGERFGFGGAAATSKPTIWLHAVSVGETRAAQPLVSALRERYPGHRILFTHMTPTGRATSEALYGDAVERIYLPYDTPWAARRFLRRARPVLGLIMETELWPNLIAACRREGVPLYLVNARLSARSARRYARFPSLTRSALLGLSGIGAQSIDDARRLVELGAEPPSVTGNMKFDAVAPESQLRLAEDLRRVWGQRHVWLAASTREGEEALIVDAWVRAGAGASALLLLVPRHPQRVDDVARLVEQRGLSLQRRSANLPIAPTTRVVLGDSMGEMFAYYASADLAFIGGSLLDYGSQNLIEAAACGTPILIGPSTRNFAEAAHAALAHGAARQVGDADELVRQVLLLLAAAETRQRMGEAGRAFAEHHRGATARTLALITPEGY